MQYFKEVKSKLSQAARRIKHFVKRFVSPMVGDWGLGIGDWGENNNSALRTHHSSLITHHSSLSSFRDAINRRLYKCFVAHSELYWVITHFL
ncbi:MAG: hypothetical protein V7K67_28405 [Nostoc sp.]